MRPNLTPNLNPNPGPGKSDILCATFEATAARGREGGKGGGGGERATKARERDPCHTVLQAQIL